jgi:hypothetical protein
MPAAAKPQPASRRRRSRIARAAIGIAASDHGPDHEQHDDGQDPLSPGEKVDLGSEPDEPPPDPMRQAIADQAGGREEEQGVGEPEIRLTGGAGGHGRAEGDPKARRGGG